MEFQEKVNAVLNEIGAEKLFFDPKEAESYAEAYAFVEAYAMEKQLFCTAVALPLVRGIMSQAAENALRRAEKARFKAYFRHCLAVSRMLIDLDIPLTMQEEDFMLAAAICHILPENPTTVTFENMKEELIQEYHLAREVEALVELITREDGLPAAEQKKFYERIRENKLATLIRLADRGNLVQQLYGISTWNAKQYIHETKEYFFPLCIYAKEHYPELIGTISVMMEKMRCHIEVSEIMLNRFEAREQQLMQEVLELQEENARIRWIIQKLQNREENPS